MMAMRVSLVAAYLSHDRAVAAGEMLDAFRVTALPWMKPADQQRELTRLQRMEAGEALQTAAELAAARKATFDSGWAGLRAHLGRPVSVQK